jgi:hypothetical protein
MIDPEVRKRILEDLASVREEMSITKTPSPPVRRWTDLSVYIEKVDPAFRTLPDYLRAVLFFDLHRPKLDDILHDKSKN